MVWRTAWEQKWPGTSYEYHLGLIMIVRKDDSGPRAEWPWKVFRFPLTGLPRYAYALLGKCKVVAEGRESTQTAARAAAQKAAMAEIDRETREAPP